MICPCNAISSSATIAELDAVVNVLVTPESPSTFVAVPFNNSPSINLDTWYAISSTTKPTISNLALLINDLEISDKAPAKYPSNSIDVNFPTLLSNSLNSVA